MEEENKDIKNNVEETVEDKDVQNEELLKCGKERDEYLELSKRLKADFVNLKSEMELQSQRTREFANEIFVMQMLPILDSLELALLHTPDDLKENNWVKGMLGIKGQFEQVLKAQGVEEINSVGEKFDPSIHEAVAQEESDKGEDVVLEELQKGYRMKNKIIRPAKVKVSK